MDGLVMFSEAKDLGLFSAITDAEMIEGCSLRSERHYETGY
jgi:hypothetical protein